MKFKLKIISISLATILLSNMSMTESVAINNAPRLENRQDISSTTPNLLSLDMEMIVSSLGQQPRGTSTNVLQPILKAGEDKITSSQPTTVEEFEKVLLHMSANNKYVYEITYNNMTFEQLERLVDNVVYKAHDLVFAKYPEYFSFTNGIKINMTNKNGATKLTLTLYSPGFTIEQTDRMKAQSYRRAEDILAEMFESGLLKTNMTDVEKLQILYKWIIQKVEYDYTLSDISRTNYGALFNNKAICHGYAGTFNMMAKMLGINVEGVVGKATSNNGASYEDHIWTAVNINGEVRYIDPTWGDQGHNADMKYFLATEQIMRVTHIWGMN